MTHGGLPVNPRNWCDTEVDDASTLVGAVES
jgi:hypothetical protein